MSPRPSPHSPKNNHVDEAKKSQKQLPRRFVPGQRTCKDTNCKERRSPRASPPVTSSPFSTKEKRRLSRPVSSVFSPPGDTSGELRPLIMVDMVLLMVF
jgi:hypothetical protein